MLGGIVANEQHASERGGTGGNIFADRFGPRMAKVLAASMFAAIETK